MEITHFLYNSFIIETDNAKIVIDPGINLNLYWPKLASLIPKSEWQGVTHILVTHGDPDHFFYTVRMANYTNAPVICGKPLVRVLNKIEQVEEIAAGEIFDAGPFQVEGIKTIHGPLVVKYLFGLFTRTYNPGPGKRVGMGMIGYKIRIGDKTILNLGDTLLEKGLEKEWKDLRPDVVMLPIGGEVNKTFSINYAMNAEEALEAVKLISPKKVIPCHYNCGFLWQRQLKPVDDEAFKNEVEKMGIECIIMKYGDILRM